MRAATRRPERQLDEDEVPGAVLEPRQQLALLFGRQGLRLLLL
ncbi:MAG: hypothetical protein ACYDGR_14120 [Candidatus Dormibacteria bacterium]